MKPMFWSRPSVTLGDKLWRVNWGILAVVALLAAIGTATLYSVAGGSFEPWAERHALRFLLGVAAVLVMAAVPLSLWMRLAYPAYAVALLLLALVPMIGVEALGARRWLALGGVSLQPSELMKVAIVAALARYYHWLPAARISRPVWVLLPLAMIALPVGLTLRQPDLGTAALFASVGLATMMLAGVSWLWGAAGLAGAALAAPFAWDSLHDYQRRRIEVFLDPSKDPLGAGYHITQSKIALGSGGVSGRGFLAGPQSQLDFVPEKHTDFIFAILAEEWGFVGGITLVALYLVLIVMVLAMAASCRSTFGRLLVGGLAVTLFVYVVVNVGMVTGLLPVVGVPLPLVSYGGTAMATIRAGLGLAISAHVHASDALRSGRSDPWW